VVHVEAPGGGKGLAALGRTEGVSGLTASHEPSAEIAVLAGSPFVVDRLRFGGVELTLRRHVLSFFQGNRYLLNRLIAHVVEQVPDGCAVVDLFAGGGAFAVAAAILKSARVVAVEGDAMAAADLAANAAASGGTIRAVRGAVEDVSPEDVGAPEVVVVDPPRTGLSKEALARVLPIRARRVIYVSCDVATLARDARRLVDAGYRIGRVDGFDLFPNTPHVETVTVFER
jgi:23S rRNA (uracil1939-C5)-methyltransferase